jgi:glycylpeptide N-tetradecanoyltransferase
MADKKNKDAGTGPPPPSKPEQEQESAGGHDGAVLKKLANMRVAGAEQAQARRMKGQADDKPHAFWDSQPVPRLGEAIGEEKNEWIEAPKDPVKDIRQTPLNLPAGFEWVETNVLDDAIIKEVYDLLNQNYVEDDDNMFRFDYSMQFLRWALTSPGFRPAWHIGVRATSGAKKLLAFITAIPVKIRVFDKVLQMAEVNFLCVHKKLRAHRLAPVLISEITRRVNVTNIWQAVYTAGKVLPKPIASCKYWHRNLNPKKLIDVGFSHLPPRATMAMTIKLYKLPENPLIPGLRPFKKEDAPQVQALLTAYLAKFKVAPTFDVEEIAHWLNPVSNVLECYVVADAQGKITDFLSFYALPSTIIGNEKYKTLKAAYAFYTVATTVSMTKLMNDALIIARKLEYDVFNCLDILDNHEFLSELKFGMGDGNLQYYFYNWKCRQVNPKEMGLVLL